MALQKNQVAISFASGIDTKTDDKQVLPSRLLELENGIFNKLGKIRKRNGYDLLSKKLINSSESILAASGISTFKNELVLFDGKKLYTYVEAIERWLQKGSASSVTISNKFIVKNPNQQANPDFSFNQGISCYVFEESSGGVRYSIIDETTGSILKENQILSGSGVKPRTVALGNYILIFYIVGSVLKFQYVTVTSPTVLSSPVDVTTSFDPTDKIYDIQKIGNRAYVAYNTNNASKSIATFYITENLTVSSEIEYVGEECPRGVSLTSDSNDNIWIAWADSSAVKYTIRDESLDTLILAPTVVESLSLVRNVALTETDVDTCTILYEVDNSPSDNFVKRNEILLNGTVGTPNTFVRSVGLFSKFFNYDSKDYICLTFSSELQSTYFIYSLDEDILTKISQNNGGGYTTTNMLTSVYEIDPGVFKFANLKKGTLQTEDGKTFTSLGVNSSKIDFVSLNNFITAKLGNNLHIVGGILQSYDGVSTTETGFNVFPESISVNEINVGSGSIPNGLYSWVAVYAWIDNQGQIHRSAPSIPVNYEITAGPSDIEVEVPTLRLTKKSNVFIEVYRTDDILTGGGDIYYKLTSNTSPLLNDKTVDSVTYTDDEPSATLSAGEILYTTGGVLDNIAPPSASVVTDFKNRLVIKSSDEENVLWYSKIREENKPVEFSDFLKIVVDEKGGDVTALGTLDDKLVIFKEEKIYMQAGDGPNNLGEQSDFGLPQSISSDVGCVDVNSVVQTPVGLMFKAQKGIYLLNRGLYADYIGAEVEKFNSSRITSAILIADANQVRFTTEDNLCLVYDYYFKQWSTFTNHEAVGATLFDNKFCYVKSNSEIYLENSGKFSDGSQPVKMKIVTAWVRLADMQGYQRLYKLLLIGQYYSKHRLRVKMGYNFNNSFTQEVIIDPYSVINPTTYGEDSPYGSQSPYGGNFPLYQWRVFPKLQKCQAFRVCIEDIQDDIFGESFDLSNLRMEVGIKQGSNKLGTDRSYATE